jgi:hypothetical protein
MLDILYSSVGRWALGVERSVFGVRCFFLFRSNQILNNPALYLVHEQSIDSSAAAR